MKRVKILIIILAILIIITIVTIVLLNLYQKAKEKELDKIGDSGEEVSYDVSKKEEVTDTIDFYSVESCVNEYFSTVDDNSSRYYGNGENGEYVKLYTDNEINELKYNLLSNSYREKNSITIDNVNNYIKSFEDNTIFTALKMLYIKGKKIDNYLVYGIITDVQNNYISDIYMFVYLNKESKRFSIEPLMDNYEDINQIDFEYIDMEIKENGNNSYKGVIKTDEQIIKDYFIKYKRIIQARPDIIYNNYMSEEYRNNRFGSLNDFQNYVEKNKREISSLQINKYMVNTYQEYKEYVCTDQYENTFVFKEKSIMNYELTLDTYTIASDKFLETYNSSQDQGKVMLNIDKWRMMINNRDYKAAYNVLDETFRNNTFGSLENFENYMRQNYSEHYNVNFDDFSNEGNTYIQKVTLDTISGSENTKEMTIIMRLDEGINFTMSFVV